MSAKRLIALLLGVILMLSLAACAGDPITTDAEPSAAADATTTEPANEPASDTAIPDATNESAEGPEESIAPDTLPTMDETGKVHAAKKSILTYPVGDGTQSLSYWYGGWNSATYGGLENPTEAAYYQTLADATGVQIEYRTCATNAASEQKSLMYVSQDYPDIIPTSHDDYPGGILKAYEDEVFMDLSDVLPTYAPDYIELLKLVPDYQTVAVEDDGRYYMMIQLNTSIQWPCVGPLVNKAFLDEQGIPAPRTYEDFFEMLMTFKNAYGCQYTYMLSADGLDQTFLAGYDVSYSGWQINDNGQVEYSFTKDGYRKYLEYVAKMFENGLIDSDFVNMNVFGNGNELYIGNAAACCSYFTMPNNWQKMGGGADFIMTPVNFPTEDGTGVVHIGQANPYAAASGHAVAATCQDPGLALSWLNYFYTQEGWLLRNYGVENETFYYDENGAPQFTDLINNNPMGQGPSKYTYFDSLCCNYTFLYDWDRDLLCSGEFGMLCEDYWTTDSSHILPDAITMTAEEGEEYQYYYGNISTYATEMLMKFIMGMEPLNDETWSTYIARIDEMGIQNCIDMKQAAYDRYLAR